MAPLAACGWHYEQPESEHSSRFYGENALLAADEPGVVLFSPDYRRDQRDLVLTTDDPAEEVQLGRRSDRIPGFFGSGSLNEAILESAPAGTETTLELHHQGTLLDKVNITYASEGTAGLSAVLAGLDMLGSEDPRGAACVVERVSAFVVFTRRATDGRVLDSPFPGDAEVRVPGPGLEAASIGYFHGTWAFELRTSAVGTHDVRVTSSERTWVIPVRVVSDEELVTLELFTWRTHDLPRGIVFVVPRTADGCPVLGTDGTLVVDGVRSFVRSDDIWVDPDSVAEGDEITVEVGALSATARF